MYRTTVVLSLLIVFVFAAVPSLAQPPDTLWTQAFGGTADEKALSVRQTSDGGFITVGHTYSFGAGSTDIWLIKTDETGIEEWNQTFGGVGYEYGRCVQQTTDGGYIVAGTTHSFGNGLAETWLVKVNSAGTEEWNHTYGGGFSDEGYYVQATSDGGYIITGWTDSYGAGNQDVWLIKTNADGVEQWSQTFGGGGHDYGSTVHQTDDGGYIITGYTYSFGAGEMDVWLIKTDSVGTEEWNQTFGGVGIEDGHCVQLTTDGGYIITGYTNSFGAGGADVLLIKTDSDGNEIWTRTYGGADTDQGFCVRQTSDGGYVIAGDTESFGAANRNVYVIRTNPDGIELWSQTYGDEAWDYGYDIQLTNDGGYIVAGQKGSYGENENDVWLIRLDSEEPMLTITLTPSNPPLLIPASGGTFEYNALIQNPTDFPITFDAWTEVDLINGNTFGPIELRQNLTLQAGGQFDVMLSQNVPGFLLAGYYTFRGCVGNYPDEIISSSVFQFEKLSPNGQSNVDSWDTTLMIHSRQEVENGTE